MNRCEGPPELHGGDVKIEEFIANAEEILKEVRRLEDSTVSLEVVLGVMLVAAIRELASEVESVYYEIRRHNSRG